MGWRWRANLVSSGFTGTDILNFIPGEAMNFTKGKIAMGYVGEPGELKGTYLYLPTRLGSSSDASCHTTGIGINRQWPLYHLGNPDGSFVGAACLILLRCPFMPLSGPHGGGRAGHICLGFC
ncbi:hypothetical protein GGS23DRAFT_433452 [Durotheca rogersii]|uniref:uncharacterized protein n=1 Tax=Durotheca rogersii TaxID=419775 RepID=UPI00221EC447|nr:uncharacterized protein GGS23DRAFT_433452 [Durotheca rogersii]KAI5865574.1 hypothetical protein GGS23DRAFT_433452 [Durotheca rogersii]